MKLLLIHLSDIHITNDDDVITGRYPQIVNAVRNIDYSLDICVVVVTGDIAFSGTDEQYLVAFEFFESLKQSLSDNLSGSADNHMVPVHLIMIPGNHDCDFTASGAVRELIADSILNDSLARSTDHDIVQTCTAVQKHFFDFVDAVETSPRMPSSQDFSADLSYEYTISNGNESVKILCCNTAWLSSLNESQGRLLFPSQAVARRQEVSDLVVAAFHHPYNWLEANNARSFRENIEATADLILTGHEHTVSWRVQEGGLGQKNICVEGGVLQDNTNPALSEFNVFVFDTSLHRKKYAHFRWDREVYTPTNQSSFGDEGSGLGWTEYRINGLRGIGQSQLADDMKTYLDDPGISLRHAERGLLKLQDVFLYPDLVEVRIRGDRFGQRISGERLVSLMDSNHKLIITGDTESGKTCLAKKLYVDLLQNGVVPVLVDGTQQPPPGDRVYGYIEGLFSNQYSSELLEAYRQTDKSLRAIIIDDYDKLPLSSERKKQFLDKLSSSAKYLVVLSHDITSDLDELSNPREVPRSAGNIAHYRIQPFGYVGRNRLVERWMLLGESADPKDSNFVRQLARTNETLNTLVGKNHIPSYPVYVLSVLQALDSATPIDITASTHGYFYELFIRTTLARGRTNKDFDIIASYLAHFSYQMQEKKLRVATNEEFRAIHSAYEESYDIKRPLDSMKTQLVEQGILINVHDGVKFKYSYIYNYFVASYMRDHIAEPKVRQMLVGIVQSVHTESNANILLFLAHLSRDPIVIEELLTASRNLYPSYAPAELKDDMAFLTHLLPGLPDAVYEEKDPNENREAMYAEMDRNHPPDSGLHEMDIEQEDSDVDIEDPIVQFIAALRHLEILGQVLKNFPGSLEASVKLDIARECFYLGLRSLSVVFEMIRLAQTDILNAMSEQIRQRHPRMTSSEIDIRAKESLTGLLHVLSYGLIKRVANAVGSRDLFNTYERLLAESRTPAFSLINSALNLDNSSEFPNALIRTMASEFRDIPLPLSVLRHLVVAHFHLFPVDFKTKQSICSRLDIKYSAIQRSNPVAQMLPRGGTSSPSQ